jgi:hypothetical protein
MLSDLIYRQNMSFIYEGEIAISADYKRQQHGEPTWTAQDNITSLPAMPVRWSYSGATKTENRALQ